MRFPWSNNLETRQQASNYTDAIIAGLVGAATSGVGQAAKTAATEFCAGLWGRSFAAAQVSPMNGHTSGLTAGVLEIMGRELVKNGACLFEIRVVDGKVRLIPSAFWDVYGDDSDPTTWTYRSTVVGPSATSTTLLSASRVVHLRYGVSPADPWIGVSPINRATLTANLISGIETSLGREMNGPVGSVLPLPAGQRDALKEDLKTLNGHMAMVDSVSDWADSTTRRPTADWQQKRIGPMITAESVALWSRVQDSILDCCGVPSSLAGASSDGTAQREAYRRFAASTIEPVLRVVSEELRDKLNAPDLSFDLSSLYARDLVGRASSFRSMVSSGMDIDRALAISGLTAED